MKKLLIGLLGLMCFIVVKAQAVDGIYFLLEGGWAEQLGLPSPEQVNASSIDETKAAIRGSVGYNHDFNQYIGMGIEVGEGRFGETTYHFPDAQDMQITLDTLEFLGSITSHIQQFDLFVKVGGLRLTPNVSGNNAAEGSTIIYPEAIIGSAYNFQGTTYPLLRHVAITLSYEKILASTEGKQDLTDPIDNAWGACTVFDAILLGVRYTFGP